MQNFTKSTIVFLLSIVYYFIFWNQGIGLNECFFCLLVLAVLIGMDTQKLRDPKVLTGVFFTLLSLSFVLIHSTENSIIAHFASFTITVSFIHEARLRIVLSALGYSIINVFEKITAPFEMDINPLLKITFFQKLKKVLPRQNALVIIPLFILGLFTLIFVSANPIFAEAAGSFFNNIGLFLQTIFKDISFESILFYLSGLTICAALFFKSRYYKEKDLNNEAAQKLTVERRKTKMDERSKLMDLKLEYKIAFASILLVNLLLLIINSIDIIYLWFDQSYIQNSRLSEQVHEGTYMLIFSILLSMGFLLYYFRANINFYKNNKALKYNALIWIFQNLLLSVSVFIRCLHYVEEHGLAYKRIGVVLFLCLTIYGLYTLARKITERKSMFYLIRNNSFALWILLVCMSAINWDYTIVEFNLRHKNLSTGKIDLYFLVTRSDSTLELLYQHKKTLENAIEQLEKQSPEYSPKSYDYIMEKIIDRIDKKIEKQQAQSFLSWTFEKARQEKFIQSIAYQHTIH